MKVLFIGNSYTYYHDLPKLFEQLASENGEPLEAWSVTCGGRRLIENLEKTDDEYAVKLNVLMQEHVFDYVILQEHSLGSLLQYDEFCRGISGLREKLQACTKHFVLYETWGRKPGSPTLAEYGWTQKSMTFAIADAYRKAGETFGFPVSYVGLKFYAVSRDYPQIDLFEPDLTHPSYTGSCLAAVTLFETLFHRYPQNMASLGLSEEIQKAFRAQF